MSLDISIKPLIQYVSKANYAIATQFNKVTNFVTTLYGEKRYGSSSEKENGRARFHHNLRAGLFNGLTLLGGITATRLITKGGSFRSGVVKIGLIFWARHLIDQSSKLSQENKPFFISEEPNNISNALHSKMKEASCPHNPQHPWHENMLSINGSTLLKNFSVTLPCLVLRMKGFKE